MTSVADERLWPLIIPSNRLLYHLAYHCIVVRSGFDGEMPGVVKAMYRGAQPYFQGERMLEQQSPSSGSRQVCLKTSREVLSTLAGPAITAQNAGVISMAENVLATYLLSRGLRPGSWPFFCAPQRMGDTWGRGLPAFGEQATG
jgi:hypothetical protein